MDQKPSIVMPLLVAIVVSGVVFGGLGYFLANMMPDNDALIAQVDTASPTPSIAQSTATPSVAPSASTTPTTTASATATPAANSTYTNATYGISFDYPRDWTVKTVKTTDNRALALTVCDTTPRQDTDLPCNMTVDVYASVTKLDTKNLGATNLKDYLDKYAALSDPIYKNIKTARVGNRNGYSAEAGPNQFGGGTDYFVSLNDGTVIDVWQFSAQDKLADKVLSSFTFTK